MNHALAIATAAAVVCSALYATASAAAPHYQMTQLNAIATATGTYAVANAINDKGQIVGGEAALTTISGTASFRVDWTKVRPITWSAAGVATLLPVLAGNGGIAASVNNAGLIGGVSASTAGTFPPTRATMFRSTGATLIAPQGASNYSRVAGINANGVALVEDSARLYRYDATTNTLAQIQSANGYGSIGINDASSVLANAPATLTLQPPYLFDAGATAGTKLYTTGPTPGIASDLNNNADAVGRARSGDYYLAASFSGGVATTLTLGTFTAGYANGLNDRGDIVGIAGNGNFAAKDGKAFLRRDGTMIDLSTLITGGTLPAGFIPTDINDRGQIIGNLTIDDDNNAATPTVGRAYILNPIRNAGDANNDNVVNFDDLTVVAQNYSKSGDGKVFWETGDFNYDNVVNFDDLVILAQHYNKTANIAADWALAQSLVPEPTGVAALGVAAFAVSRRRSG